MSQPILVLSNPTRPDIDTDDISDQSNSPGPASPVSYSLSLQNQFIGAPKVSVQSTFSNSSGFSIRDTSQTQPNGAAIVNSNARPLNESILNPLKPGAPVKRPLSKSVDLTLEERRPSLPKQLPPISTVPLLMSPANGDGTAGSNVQIATRTPKVNTNADQDLLMHSSTPALVLSESGDGRNVVMEKARDSRFRQESSPSPYVLKRERVGPKLTLNTTMIVDIDGNNSGISSAINTTSNQKPPFPPIPSRTVSNAPRLSLPPANHRFSLNLVDGYSARMSPSVILRPPPLPLLNLPVLPDITSSTHDAASSRRSKRAGLMSMPALPRHGTSRGTSGHEELDDVESESESEDDGDGVDDDDDDDGGPDNTSLEDESNTPLSDSSTSTISSRSHSPSPSISSHETFHESSTLHNHEDYFGGLTTPKKRSSKFPFLPPVDMSQIDLSFLDTPPKSKGKARELTEDAGRTPTATVWPNGNGGIRTPTAFRKMDFGTKIDTWAASPVVPKGSHPSSPSQTPRPGGHFKLPPPVPNTPSSARLMRSTTENRLSVLSRNSISQFPGIYSRASQSLIDVHALEKKEKVEKLVREEEEGAEEERKRRVKVRMSMRVVTEGDDHATTMSHDHSGGDVDGRSETFVHNRMSLIPNRIDPAKPSEASSSSSPTANLPKSNNRISMAPAYETIIPLRRRLSMPTFNATSTPPPPYPDLFPKAQSYGVKLTQIQPRDDEGREKLPAYSNSIYIKAIMPRKLEFARPGVQAKDRKWKRVLCVLEGTSFKVYKPPGVSTIGKWWENKVGVGDMAVLNATNSNSASKKQTAQGGGTEVTSGAVRQSKEEVEMERVRMRDMTATRPPTQFGDARQRQESTTTNHSGGPVLPATKSALNLAVHLLIPSSRGHTRFNSDVGQSSNTPSVSHSSRPSLNIPMNGRSTPTPTIGSTTTIASRSSSPMFAASSSSLLTTPAGSSWSHDSTDSTPSSTGRGARSGMVTNNYTVASSPSTSKGKGKVDDSDLLPDTRSLIKAYTMQEAESGLGSDYVKRKHVIRVRLEGEQFLLQASDVDSVIEWIEVSFSCLSFLAIFNVTCRAYKLRQILQWT